MKKAFHLSLVAVAAVLIPATTFPRELIAAVTPVSPRIGSPSAQRPSSREAISLYNQGNTYKQAGKVDEAIEAYKKALTIDPNFADAHYNLGRTYYMKAALANGVDPEARFITTGTPTQKYRPKWDKAIDQLQLAAKEFQEVARLQSAAADVQSMLGLVYHNMGDYDNAIAYNHRAVELDPAGLDGQDSRHDNALIYFYVLKKKDEAIRLLRKNLEVNPNHAASRQLLRLVGEKP